ncbi:hypothetical protein J6590_052189 [Homalodisca vitripennis]|nr:hypothetical protein J6590_052189 [Homalodisca vitripennis]
MAKKPSLTLNLGTNGFLQHSEKNGDPQKCGSYSREEPQRVRYAREETVIDGTIDGSCKRCHINCVISVCGIEGRDVSQL